MNALLQSLFDILVEIPAAIRWTFFLLENVAITSFVLLMGRFIQKRYSELNAPYSYTKGEWLLCIVTNVLNTIVTYAGFWLWTRGFISIKIEVSFWIVVDFLVLFLSMDFLMYVFHFIIHKTFLYKAMHQLHHEAVDPKPIDLFVLHPVETIAFGSLWLILLAIQSFNIYAILAYLTANVIFGLIGHLGIEPIGENVRMSTPLRFLGTSTFHHNHHQNVSHNFGFYTTLWDRLFGTHM